jgi:hypothetical protein
MLVLIMGITPAEALVPHLTPPAPSQRKQRRITTKPLLTTRRFDQRRCGLATEAPMLAGSWFGFHAVRSHRGHLLGEGAFVMPHACCRGASRRPSLSPIRSSLYRHPRRPLAPAALGGRAHEMRQRSTVKPRRDPWQHQATQRGDHHRYQRKPIARLTAACHRVTAALKAAQARLRQLESPPPEWVALAKVAVVFLAL